MEGKKKKNRAVWVLVIAACLVFSYWYGGGSKSLHGWGVSEKSEPQQEPSAGEFFAEEKKSGFVPKTDVPSENNEKTKTGAPSGLKDLEKSTDTDDAAAPGNAEKQDTLEAFAPAEKGPEKISAESEAQKTTTENLSAESGAEEIKPEKEPAESDACEVQEESAQTQTKSCTISICCKTILSNIDMLDPDKRSLIPSDGVILSETKIDYSEGESVFDVLLRVCREKKIHLEFSMTPVYNSAYIEGIHNLYEFDCGELSGWMFSVNGEFPNVGCSSIILNDGDEIEFLFTCDLGADLGAGF